MVDDLNRDLARRRHVERDALGRIERRPCRFVDLGSQRAFQLFVGFIRAQEVGVTDEETFFVVVSVDEPSGNAIGVVANHFAGLRLKDVHTIHFHAKHPVFLIQERYVGLAENHKEVALACVFEVV